MEEEELLEEEEVEEEIKMEKKRNYESPQVNTGLITSDHRTE